ncbi:hypothetical protein DACRYDRAFT_69684 [Dacryopinax primogenitus]|uniref:ATP-dependent RNA helicase n=1 Tax=Dacryopinax primogenitus (strain DJM 731) TaxID=1858805 RepID=M5FQR1_DACPD|nr:uncharacterized protein DACRYDRAFT_69684 [Dacryopinax primogenitus]EJT99275.1 hypothetical protein DACRYDRAFT_69684 [Dacryopinax primogenitus]
MEDRARLFTRGHVGVVILTSTRERATEIANDALKLVQRYEGFELRLLVDGERKTQMREFMTRRRDVVVGTPGRIRDLLENEDEFARGMAKTKMLIFDDTATMLTLGLRDDMDAVSAYLPDPARVTWIYTTELTLPLRQAVRTLLSPNHLFIHEGEGVDTPPEPWEHVKQYHTVLPHASDQLPHLTKLIAHDQLSNPGRSRVVIFTPTARVAQLFTTFLRHLAPSLPAGGRTTFHEVHSTLQPGERTAALHTWVSDPSGSSVLLSSEISLKAEQYGPCTRIIQLGIPPSAEIYAQRISRACLPSADLRADLVLLQWEIGFLSWILGQHPFHPCTTAELGESLTLLAEKSDSGPLTSFPPSVPATEALDQVPAEIRQFDPGVAARLATLPELFEALKPQVDELAVKQTFASLLGYYIPKSGDLRVSRQVVIQGCKDWPRACGLQGEAYVSPEFVRRLGMEDTRGKRFASAWKERVGGMGMAVRPRMLSERFRTRE